MMLYQQAANERKCPGKIQGKCFNYFGTFSKMVDSFLYLNDVCVLKRYKCNNNCQNHGRKHICNTYFLATYKIDTYAENQDRANHR